MRLHAVASVLLALGGWQVNAFGAQATEAQPDAASDQVPRLSFGLTASAGTVLGSLCAPTKGDALSCGLDSTIAGLRLAPRWRLSRDWAVGISAGVGWLGRAGEVPTSLWDAQVAGRYYLGATSASQYWVDANAGLSALVEDWPAYVTEPGAPMAARTLTSWAPSGSLAIGRDLVILRYFGIAPEMRVHLLGFRDADTERAAQYRPQVLLVVGVSVIGFADYR